MDLLEQTTAAQRIFFGRASEALARLEPAGPVLVLGSARSVASVDAASLGSAGEIETFDRSGPHNPRENVTEAVALARRLAPRTLLAVGSSSAMDLGKAVRGACDAFLICVPSALGGAEMTRGFGVVESDGRKVGAALSRPAEAVVYDPAQLAGLGAKELGSIGINAFAHTIEAHYARRAVPIGVAAAEKAGRALAVDLLAAATVRDEAMHRKLFESAYLAGLSIDQCGLALHHATCHVLGGLTRVPHGIVNAIVLPLALEANARLAPEAVARVAAAFGVGDLAERARTIARAFGLPASLAELGYGADVATRAFPLLKEAAHLRNNPAPVDDATLERILHAAVMGDA